ncbi:MAG: hypothetical protein MUC88_20795 [Planctomycetes bacterium]|jgi:hypothetical protein|nr:hypothetical protein [Planctomycetota bacterium]
MTKKDFIALADAIREHRKDFGDGALACLADFCYNRNPAFKRSRWLDYIDGVVGPNGGKLHAIRSGYMLHKLR